MRSSASGHARLAFAGSMLVFGTIGLLRRFIDLPSAVIACFRGLLGCVLLLLLQRLRGRKPDLAALRRYLPALLISGGMIGFNWMLLFEAYRYTTIAVATLCYYMAPVLLIAFSPLLFKEKLTGRQIVCVLLAALGMEKTPRRALIGVMGVMQAALRDAIFRAEGLHEPPLQPALAKQSEALASALTPERLLAFYDFTDELVHRISRNAASAAVTCALTSDVYRICYQ